MHHEIELVVKLGTDLTPEKMTLGLDLTKRSIQDRLKQNGLPWAEAKAFKSSAIVGEWIDFDKRAEYTLEINGSLVQNLSLIHI